MDGPTIGILSPLMTGYYYGSLVSSVNQVVSAAGGRLIAISTAAFSSGYHREMVIEHLPHLGWRHIDGFVTIANAVSLEYLEALRDSGKPVVALGHEEPGFSYPTVLPDNHGGTRQAVEHLIGHGHTRIAFAGSLQHFDIQERYAAYRNALLSHGMEPDPALLYDIDDNNEFAGRRAAERMLAAGLPSTAVVAACDQNAVGIIAVLKEAGLVLPNDQAVTGFDDLPGVASMSPSLSSVSQHLDEMGSLGAQLVMRMAAGQRVQPGHYLVNGSFIARDSCGCASHPLTAGAAESRPGEQPVPVFVEAMRKAAFHSSVGSRHGFPADKVTKLAGTVRLIVQRSATSEVAAEDLVALSHASQELYALGRSHAAFDAILSFTGQVCQQVEASVAKSDTAATTRVHRCAHEVRLGLSQALLNERNDSYYELRKAIRDEHEISLYLMRSHESDPRELGWLSQTKAVAGMLALWQQGDGRAPAGEGGPAGALAGTTGPLDLKQAEVAGTGHEPGPGGTRAGESPPRVGEQGPDGTASAVSNEPGGNEPGGNASSAATLQLVGTYDPNQLGIGVGGEEVDVEAFPPLPLVEAAGHGNVVLLFPVTSEDRDWGILSVAVSLDSGFLGQDTYFQWEALLSEALDYQFVLHSLQEQGDQLRERGEQLALSYRREREMAQAVRESEERYALAARAANDGLWDWDLDRGTVYYSARWAEMLGQSEDSVGNTPNEWLDRVHPEDRPGLMAELVALKLGEQPSILHEHRVMGRDGNYMWLLCRGLAVPGVGRPATRIVGSLTDVTERHLLEERLRQQALYDSLTGLPNRVLFLDRLSQALANCKRRLGQTYTVLWLDLDGFKTLNDSLGHQMGDRLLINVAERIRTQLRESDTAARFGGDEFAVLLLDIPDLQTVVSVVKRLLDTLGAVYDLDDNEVVVSASIGVAMSTNGYERPEDVLRDADIAMYRAKSDGRGTYTIFDSSMHASAMSRLKTETELRHAINPRGHDTSQMELHYQPVVHLENGQVVSMEALVRWRHPVRGLVTPLEFLQVAEDSGLIVPMGRWVAAEACRQLAAWDTTELLSKDVRVSLNLSNREFWSPRLLDHLDLVLKETGVDATRLAFEITEGVIVDNLEKALTVLHGLHDRGLQVHVDDFGTGYSSLQALHRLPIDALKIDKSFVAGLAHEERTADLIGTIIRLGQDLGVIVVAEGIENATQLESLRHLGCNWGQGYAFCPPVPASRLEHFIASGRFGRRRQVGGRAELATPGTGSPCA